jgi:hypothetical protein
MTQELTTVLATISTGMGVGAGWFLKNYYSKSTNGHTEKTEFTKEVHDERCNLIVEPILKQLERNDDQFERVNEKLDDIRELVYKVAQPWDGHERRRERR